jgi:hypothetical protein
MFQPEKHGILYYFSGKRRKGKRKRAMMDGGHGKWWSKRPHCRPQPGEATHRVRGKDK